MTDGDAVRLAVEEGVATITLDQPDRKNALSREVSDGLREMLAEIDENRRDVRCVVVRGAGGAFSAGGDIAAMREGIENDVPTEERVRELERTTSETLVRLITFPLPTVAKVNGPAVGAGANLALACDLQLASERASMGFVFRNVGLSVDAGTSYLLPRVVGENIAKELVFTGEILDAERAGELGLFNHVFPEGEFDERPEAIVERIASGPTVALRHAKRLLGEGLDRSIEGAMVNEATAQGIVFDTADHAEGVEAFLERRDPQFEGR